ncbi:hypothetical protein [Barnesiella viscericola]|uniref:hypothetical protein n=1 Tax=Barnesiella viscericola TaxID=397865 RepID=UPI00235558E8|nr:hypothetical protein [Barnesiella viscericola]
MRNKIIRGNVKIMVLFSIVTVLLFSSCASFTRTMESTDWKKTTTESIDLMNQLMQTGKEQK